MRPSILLAGLLPVVPASMTTAEYSEFLGSVERLAQAAQLIPQASCPSGPLGPELVHSLGMWGERIMQRAFELTLPLMIDPSDSFTCDPGLKTILDKFRKVLDHISACSASVALCKMSRLFGALHTVTVQPDPELLRLANKAVENLDASQRESLSKMVARLLSFCAGLLMEVGTHRVNPQEVLETVKFLDALPAKDALQISKWMLKIALTLSGDLFCHKGLLAEVKGWSETLGTFSHYLDDVYYSGFLPIALFPQLLSGPRPEPLHNPWPPALRQLQSRLELILDPSNADYSQIGQLFEVDALDPYAHILRFFKEIGWIPMDKTYNNNEGKAVIHRLFEPLLYSVSDVGGRKEYVQQQKGYAKWATHTLKRYPQLSKFFPSFPHQPLDCIPALARMYDQLNFTDPEQLRLLSRFVGWLTDRVEFPLKLSSELAANVEREALLIPLAKQHTLPPEYMLQLMLRCLGRMLPKSLRRSLQALQFFVGEGARIHVRGFGSGGGGTWDSLSPFWNPDLHPGLSLEKMMIKTREGFKAGLVHVESIRRHDIFLRGWITAQLGGILHSPTIDVRALYSPGLYQMGRWLVELIRACEESGQWRDFEELHEYREAYETCRRDLVKACTGYATLLGIPKVHNVVRPEYLVID